MRDLKKISETVELPDEIRLTVVIERKPVTSYDCGPKGHIKRVCFLNIQREPTDMGEPSELAIGCDDTKQDKRAEFESREY